jgi:hypothetical protein
MAHIQGEAGGIGRSLTGLGIRYEKEGCTIILCVATPS